VMNNLEIHIIYCTALVEMIMYRLRLWTTFGILNRPASICGIENSSAHASAYCAENSGVLALWFDPDGAVVSKFIRPPPSAKVLSFNLTNTRDIFTRDVFISRFHKLVITCIRCIQQLKLAETSRCIPAGWTGDAACFGIFDWYLENKTSGNGRYQ
jgi:hypothetical protein